MTTLVTGASGFIGGHVVERLVGEGVAVRCLVRATSDTSSLRGAELVVGDLTDAASVARAADGCSAVVHAGALVSDWATIEEIARANVEGTRNVVAACGGARLVHVSTTDVHRFDNWYARTKRAAEAEVRGGAARASGAAEAVIVRPATVYGPRSLEVVGAIAAALRSRSMVLVGGGRAVAGLTYVDNVVDAILLALRAPAGAAVDVADGLDVTWRRFADDLAAGLGLPRARWSLPLPVARALGVALEEGYRVARRATGVRTRPLLSRQAVDILGRDQSFDDVAARTVLGWEPRVGYEQGLDATLAWLRQTSL